MVAVGPGVILRICSGLHIQWSIVRFQAKTLTPILHWTTASARTHDDRGEGGGANKHISRHFFCEALRQRHRQGPFFSARDCTFLDSGLHKIMSFGTVHLFSTAPLRRPCLELPSKGLYCSICSYWHSFYQSQKTKWWKCQWLVQHANTPIIHRLSKS